MDAPYIDGNVKRYSHDKAGMLAQALPYDLETSSSNLSNNSEAVLHLPEPTPKTISIFEDRIGYAMLDMLPELVGCRYDVTAVAALRTLRPSVIRTCVMGQKLTQDAVWWRVTVHLGEGVVLRVQQEVKVVLPASCMNGRMFKLSMKFKDAKYDSETGGLFKGGNSL